MLTDKQILGKKGEQLTADYLEKKGYKIIDRNFRFGKGEIDIVCFYGDDLVIVEVKSVRVNGYGEGEERISNKKQKKIINTAYAFLDQHEEYLDFGVRFDVVVVNFSQYPVDISHYTGAFWQNEMIG